MSHRLPAGGMIDRSIRLAFHVDGNRYHGFAGDTLASAMLGAGIDVLGWSAVRARPRGLHALGSAEPNAWIEVGLGAHATFEQATMVELVDGLAARRLSGHGRIPAAIATDQAPARDVRVDLLIIGAGGAGLAAAAGAARSGIRILVVDADSHPGGRLTYMPHAAEQGPSLDALIAEVAAFGNVAILARTLVLGLFDGGEAVAVQTTPGQAETGGRPRRRIIRITAAATILATGAIERSIVFRGNDRPGVLQTTAVLGLAHRWAVRAGDRTIVVTAHDDAYRSAVALQESGVRIPVIADLRDEVPDDVAARAVERGIEVVGAAVVVGAEGDGGATRRVTRLRLADRHSGLVRQVECDTVAVSGGWDPAVSLATHIGARVRWRPEIEAYAVGELPATLAVVGRAAMGHEPGATADGHECGAAIGDWLTGRRPKEKRPRAVGPTSVASSTGAPRAVAGTVSGGMSEGPEGRLADAEGDRSWEEHFVDLHRDVTMADLRRAVRAGMAHPELLKRHTLAGTGADQGRISATLAIRSFAALLHLEMDQVTPTTSRPPLVPVTFSTLAGRDRGRFFDPERRTPLHEAHVALEAVFEVAGQWHRPRYYAADGAGLAAAVDRECLAVRSSVGIVDLSTLGKIDVRGPDAAAFLERIYATRIASQAVGTIRYALMLRPDGMVFDDGTVTRLAEDHFHLTTTTGNAAPVLEWLEEWLQTEWPHLRVRCTSVTDAWAVIGVAGPRSRDLLGRLGTDTALSANAFPFMTFRKCTLAGLPVILSRISFTGELAFEVSVRPWHVRTIWNDLLDAGSDLGIAPYGLEALHVLRAEKGYVIIGQETDGSVMPDDLGLARLAGKQGDFLGRRSLRRPDALRPDRRQLVGLLSDDPTGVLAEGGQITATAAGEPPVAMLGHVTSSYRSPFLGRSIALALVSAGRSRIGELVYVHSLGDVAPARVTEPVFVDPGNERRDG